MKKIKLMTVLFLLFLATFSYGQEASEKPDGFFDNLYIGSLTATSFSLDSTFPNYVASTSIRIGGLKTIQTKAGEIMLAGTYDSNLGTIPTIRWQMPILAWLDVQIGLIPKPICFLNRPLPVSSGGHFEPPSLGIMPGSGLGSNLIFKINETNTAYTGVYRSKKGQAEYQLGYTTKLQGWEISTAINTDTDSIFGGSLRLKSEWVDLTVFKSKEYTSSLLSVKLQNGINPYASMYFQEKNYSKILSPDEHLEVGLTKTFSKNWEKLPFSVNALIGAGYVVLPEKFLNIYFQFYIEI